MLTETQAISGLAGSHPFTYAYDVDGLLTSMTRPDASVVAYTFDARAWLATVSADGPPPLAAYTYNGRGQVTATEIEAGIFTRSTTYDAAGRLTAVSNGSLDTTGYSLSADGRRTGITRNSDSESYGYDNARQVTSGSYGGLSTTQAWAYDLAGNRTSAITNSVATTYTANSVNAYTAISGGGFVAPSPTYDANGNTLTLPRPDGTARALTWEINDRLTQATNTTTGDTASYAYDALGRRVKSTTTISSVSTTTYYLLDGWNVNLEHNGTTYSTRLTWGKDLSGSTQGAGGVGGLLMTEDLTGSSPVASYPAYDGNGNITAWINASGTVTARQRYDAYGNIIQQTGTPPSTYGFSTKPADPVTGLCYYGYRYYDTITGRWPSRDPIGERGGVNLYGFVGNNGVSMRDLLGLAITFPFIDGGEPHISPPDALHPLPPALQGTAFASATATISSKPTQNAPEGTKCPNLEGSGFAWGMATVNIDNLGEYLGHTTEATGGQLGSRVGNPETLGARTVVLYAIDMAIADAMVRLPKCCTLDFSKPIIKDFQESITWIQSGEIKQKTFP